MVGIDRDPFVGRARELTEMVDSLDAAMSNHGNLIMVAGEPGIGKTRLVEEFAACHGPRGALPLGQMSGRPRHATVLAVDRRITEVNRYLQRSGASRHSGQSRSDPGRAISRAV